MRASADDAMARHARQCHVTTFFLGHYRAHAMLSRHGDNFARGKDDLHRLYRRDAPRRMAMTDKPLPRISSILGMTKWAAYYRVRYLPMPMHAIRSTGMLILAAAIERFELLSRDGLSDCHFRHFSAARLRLRAAFGRRFLF